MKACRAHPSYEALVSLLSRSKTWNPRVDPAPLTCRAQLDVLPYHEKAAAGVGQSSEIARHGVRYAVGNLCDGAWDEDPPAGCEVGSRRWSSMKRGRSPVAGAAGVPMNPSPRGDEDGLSLPRVVDFSRLIVVSSAQPVRRARGPWN
jgi:hypothetical protein